MQRRLNNAYVQLAQPVHFADQLITNRDSTNAFRRARENQIAWLQLK